MSIKKIKQFNDKQFIDDVKMVREVMILSHKSNIFLHVLKKELLKEAETARIHYYLTDELFLVKRMSMVII